VNPHRQVDLHGSISACDAAGRALHVHCAGARLTVDAESARAALSALRVLRVFRGGASAAALAPHVLGWANEFHIELCVRGRRVGRAGLGARANWLGRALTHMPLELHAPALLRAAVAAF